MSGVHVVTVAHGRHEHLIAQRQTLRAAALEVPHVVVAMGDESIRPLLADHPSSEGAEVTVVNIAAESAPGGRLALPLAAARNLGVARAIEAGADLVVLLDVDCLAGPELLPRYVEAARQAPEDLLCGPVTYLPEGVRANDPQELVRWSSPHPARPAPRPGELVRGGDHDLFWSLSFAVTPATWERVGGFYEGYVGYGAEDTDFGWSARARGIGLTWVGGAEAYHQWHPVSRPPVEHLHDIVRNARIAHERWGRWPMEGWLTAFAERGLIRWGEDLEVTAVTPFAPTIGE